MPGYWFFVVVCLCGRSLALFSPALGALVAISGLMIVASSTTVGACVVAGFVAALVGALAAAPGAVNRPPKNRPTHTGMMMRLSRPCCTRPKLGERSALGRAGGWRPSAPLLVDRASSRASWLARL
jgi:hypothetical protein